MMQTCAGLSHAHTRGIVHRDIKPENIVIVPGQDDDGEPIELVKVCDFGIAQQRAMNQATGQIAGTPEYMSPEQCRGDELDARVDIYACGVVLFEMLTGRKPFVADEPIAIIQKQLTEPPPRLASVTPGDYGAFEGVVARALAKSPDDRYPSAVAMAEALSAAVTTREHDTTARLGAASTRELPVHRPQAPASSRRVIWWLLALAALGAAGVFAWPVIQRELADDETPVVVVPTPKPPDPTPPDAAVVVTVDAAMVVDAPAPPSPIDAIVAKAKQLAADGKVVAAFNQLRHARQIYPESAQLPLLAGKLAMKQLYFPEGILQFRAAIKLDPEVRKDPELVAAAVHAFTFTPALDPELARFVTELGESAWPELDKVAASHPNQAIRARAARLRR